MPPSTQHGQDMRLPFTDRQEAGRLLADELAGMHLVDPVVLALPRGGVPVACEVARRLNAPLDLLLARKIGVPGEPEVALAAVVEGEPPQVILDEQLAAEHPVSSEWMEAAVAQQVHEIKRRRDVYLRGRPALTLHGRTVLVVDDGMATGTTMRAALSALRQVGARRLIAAIPLAPASAVMLLAREADDVICLAQPASFRAVGEHYEDFHQLADEEVVDLLDQAWHRQHTSRTAA